MSATIASVILLFGKLSESDTYKLVDVTDVPVMFVAVTLVKLVLVVKVMAPLLNAISGVPVTELAAL